MAAAEIDDKRLDKLVQLVKKEPGNSERYYSEKSGIPMGQILRYLVVAEMKADPSLKISATGPAISKARENGVRWPRIAARTGLSEAKAKELYEAHTGKSARDSYTGRGRNWSGTTSSSKTSSGTSKTRGAASKTATSGRRGAAAKSKTATATKSRGTRGTRAAAKSADPS